MIPQPPGSFTVPTRVVTGLGSLAALPGELDQVGMRRVAVVVDAGVAASGVLDAVLQSVARERIAAIVAVPPDPDVAAVERASGEALAAGSDGVLAVGGGSALGAAKAVSIQLRNPGPISRYEGLRGAPAPPAPTIAVPTTAGSGSEVSRVLVLHEPGRTDEMIIRVAGAEPHVAILDATVLRTLPAVPLRDAALDALSHALEAQWTLRPSWFATALGRSAARTIIDRLPAAVTGASAGSTTRGADDALLQELLDASCAANMACGNSGLGLVHALSGAPATRLPHGRQNGILLPHVAAFNDPLVDPETRALAAELPGLYDRLGFTPTFPAGTDAAAMIQASRGHELRRNNRRPAQDHELLTLLVDAGATPPTSAGTAEPAEGARA